MSKTAWIAGAAALVVVAGAFVVLGGDESRIDTAQGPVTTEPLDASSDAEGMANRIEQDTSDTGDASNAATDVATAAAVSGENPTSAEVVDETREIADAEGVMGAEAFFADDYDGEIVRAGLEDSALDDTVKNQLAAELEMAEDGSEDDLEPVLAQIRNALDME